MARESKVHKKSLWTAPVEKSILSKERISRKHHDSTNDTEQKTPIGLTKGHNFNLLNLKPGVQAKLTVGAPGDKYEQEADNMAAQVMSMPDSAVQRMAPEEQTEDDEVRAKPLAANITPLVQREEIPQEEEENKVQPKIDASIQREVSSDEDELKAKPLLQRATDGSFQAGGNIESQLSSKGGGSPLRDDVRAFMEPRFGTDFSSVRVHTGDEAVQMNRELGAQAFTHGSNVYFGAGKVPGNNELTAHELTHVMQQGRGGKLQTQTIQRAALSIALGPIALTVLFAAGLTIVVLNNNKEIGRIANVISKEVNEVIENLQVILVEAGIETLVQVEKLEEFIRKRLPPIMSKAQDKKSKEQTKFREGAQDQKLTDSEIERLKKGGQDIHDLKGTGKGARTSERDLFKDKNNGDIYVKPKNGQGLREPTGLNINDF